jgi:DNA-binding beta-propeller fold protein YncE
MIVVRALTCAALAFAALLVAPLASKAEGPGLKVDSQWPKPLPNNWILGQIGGITVDGQDNIWVFQRPRSLTDDEKGAALTPPRSKCCVPAPSVLVFTPAGDLVKAWGGPGEGYDWPAVEHGILVDNKGFVWLTGSGVNDGMILKFTTDGKFVKQLGKRGPLTSSTDLGQFGQAAALSLDAPANEIYVADGYGNHRVAVIDADSGAIKRIWGAYGKPPTDEKIADFDPESKQFANPVHCVTLAANGLVYVCDRRNNRVQVFHKDGGFVRQFAFDPKTQGSGSSWGVAFSPLDKEQANFVLLDGTNNEMKTVRVADGAVLATTGRPGRQAGEFHWVHAGAFDSKGNFYTGEVDTGKRVQKFVPAN